MAEPPAVRGGSVVIGANGFIGTRLCESLPQQECTRITRDRTSGVDSASLGALHRADVVFYLATTINPALADRYPDRIRKDRAVFVRLLDRLCRLPDPPLVVFLSSGGAVYDPSAPLPFVEEHTPTMPETEYGRSKLAMENELCGRRDAVPGVILRLSNVYGPGQLPVRGQGVIAHWMYATLTGRRIQLFGDPGAFRDYVYIDDVVAAMCEVRNAWATGRAAPPVLNIGSGEKTSLGELVQAVEAAMGTTVGVDAVAGREFDRRDAVLDIGLAQGAIGWRPRTKLADGLAATWSWIRGPGFARAHAAAEAER